MCWISNKEPVFLTAKEDVEVFKIGKLSDKGVHFVRSLIMEYLYQLGKTYFIPNALVSTPCFSQGMAYAITEGFHSYDPNNLMFERKSKECTLYLKMKNTQYIAGYAYPDWLYIQAVIPKGSTYCVNEYGAIVSNAIKILSYKRVRNLEIDGSQLKVTS